MIKINPLKNSAMKRISIFICVILLLFSSIDALAQETFVEGNFGYQVTPQGVSVVSYYGSDDVVEMPSVVSHDGTDYTVIEVGNKIFFNDENVVSINFPSTALTIGDSVCHECPVLSRVVIGDDTRVIGEKSFYNCKKLMLVVLGEDMELIKANTFSGINMDVWDTMDSETSPTFVFKGPDFPELETDILFITGSSSKRFYGLCPQEHLATYYASNKWRSEWDPYNIFVMLSGYSQEDFNNASVNLTGDSDTIAVNNLTYQEYLLSQALDVSYVSWHNMEFYRQLPAEYKTSGIWNRGTYIKTDAIEETFLSNVEGDIFLSGHISKQGTFPLYLFTPLSALKINCQTLPYAENGDDCYRILQDNNMKYKIFVEDNSLVAEVMGNVRPFNNFAVDAVYNVPNCVELPTDAGNRIFNIVSIGDKAFKDSPLVSIEIGDNVKTIGEQAFSGSTYLTRVILGDGTEEIKKNAFENCPNVSLVVLGESLRNVQEGNFINSDTPDSFVTMNSPRKQIFIIQGNDYPNVAEDFLEHINTDDVIVYCPVNYLNVFENSPKWSGEFNLTSYTEDELNNSAIIFGSIETYDYHTDNVVVFGRLDIEDFGGDISNEAFNLKLPLKFNNTEAWNCGFIDLNEEFFSHPTWTVNEFFNDESGIYIQGAVNMFNPNQNTSGWKNAYLFTPNSIVRVPIYAWSKWATSSINKLETSKQIVKQTYFNLQGVESAEPQQGVNIRVTTFSDGSRQIEKILK